MRQQVEVKSVGADGYAQVEAVRRSACSGDCDHCGGCASAKQHVLVRAKNPIGAGRRRSGHCRDKLPGHFRRGGCRLPRAPGAAAFGLRPGKYPRRYRMALLPGWGFSWAVLLVIAYNR